MRILVIDTSLEACTVAVAAGAGAAVVRSELIGKGHQERLQPMIADAMAAAGLGYAELDRIAVAVGPGSFTGIRVGVAAARGLALVTGAPAVGVSTLAALAMTPGLPAGPVVAAIDARKGEIYVAAYLAGATGAAAAAADDAAAQSAPVHAAPVPVETVAPRLLPAADAVRLVPDGAAVVGSGAPQLAAALAAAGGAAPGAILPLAAPSPAALLRLAAAATPPFAAPLPLYLRAADAKPQPPSGLVAAMPVPA